jgi:hypothetical protein
VIRAALFSGLMLLVACRSSAPVAEQRVAGAAPAGVVSSAATPLVAAASSHPTASSASARHVRPPIADKPFPEGASDETVCRSIHSAEKDPWLRFGHFLPMYLDSVVWVGDGDQAQLAATLEAIDRYAPRLYLGIGRACSRGGVLVYVEGLREDPVQVLGQTYSLAQLEAAVFQAAPSAKQVLREHFVSTREAGALKMRDVCAAGPALCEQLLGLQRLDGPKPSGSGLCQYVIREAQSYFAMSDRSWAKDPAAPLDEPALAAACERLAPAEKVCALLGGERAERRRCWESLAPKLGL